MLRFLLATLLVSAAALAAAPIVVRSMRVKATPVDTRLVREPAQILGSDQTITFPEMKALGAFYHCPAYMALPKKSSVQVLGAGLVRLTQDVGAMVTPGTVIDYGLFWNPTGAAIAISINGGHPTTLDPHSFLPLEILEEQTCQSCSVSCPSGTYSCCNFGDPRPVCKCITTGAGVPCEDGGDPSLSCSISQSDPHDLGLCP